MGDYWGTSSQNEFDRNEKKKPKQKTPQARIYLIRQVREGRLTKLTQKIEASGCLLQYQVPVPLCLDAPQLFDSLQARYPPASGLH